jgi:hypothetical protein
MAGRGHWVVVNYGIAFAVLASGMAALTLSDLDGSGGIAESLGLALFLTIYLAPYWVPGVFVQLLVFSVLAQRIRPRLAAVVTSPIAPGFLWYWVVVFWDPLVVAIGVVGTAMYAWLSRLPGERPARTGIRSRTAVVR